MVDARAVVEGDLSDIDSCDAMLVYYPGPSAGTCIEVFYAARFARRGRKLSVFLADVSGKPLSPWISHHVDVRAFSLEDALTSFP